MSVTLFTPFTVNCPCPDKPCDIHTSLSLPVCADADKITENNYSVVSWVYKCYNQHHTAQRKLLRKNQTKWRKFEFKYMSKIVTRD